MREPAVAITQLQVNYDKTTVLWDVSLEVPSGALVGVIGPNGAGKSTLLKAALGLVKPLSGKVAFFGRPLKDVRKRIAYVPQRESVDWEFPLTLFDLVLMGRYGRLGLFRRPGKADREAVFHHLEMVGLANLAKRQINQLSGGQQQRAFLARALIQEADLYFLDEPLAGIDVTSTAVILDLLRTLQREGKTVFVVHHDLASVPDIFNWVVLLNTRLIACGETCTTFTEEWIRQTYGKDDSLFEKATLLGKEKHQGVI